MTHTINHDKRTAVIVALAAIVVIALLIWAGDPMHALKVAGFGDSEVKAPSGAGGLEKMVDALDRLTDAVTKLTERAAK